MPYDLCRIRAQPVAFEPDPLSHSPQRLFGRLAFDESEVFFFVLKAWMSNAMRQFAVVRQQQEAFAIRVETAGGIEACPDRHQIDGEGFVARGRPRLRVQIGLDVAQIALGLVKDDVDLFLCMDRTAVHFDAIMVRIDLGPELGDNLAIDSHPLSQYEFFALAPGGYAGVSEHLLKTFHIILATHQVLHDRSPPHGGCSGAFQAESSAPDEMVLSRVCRWKDCGILDGFHGFALEQSRAFR